MIERIFAVAKRNRNPPPGKLDRERHGVVIGVTALTLVLAATALLTSIGAFGGPEAAAGLPPVDTVPGETAP